MKEYKKPYCGNLNTSKGGVVPAALSAQALSVGGAFVVGVASGLMKDKGIEDSMKVVSLKPVMN